MIRELLKRVFFDEPLATRLEMDLTRHLQVKGNRQHTYIPNFEIRVGSEGWAFACLAWIAVPLPIAEFIGNLGPGVRSPTPALVAVVQRRSV